MVSLIMAFLFFIMVLLTMMLSVFLVVVSLAVVFILMLMTRRRLLRRGAGLPRSREPGRAVTVAMTEGQVVVHALTKEEAESHVEDEVMQGRLLALEPPPAGEREGAAKPQEPRA